MRDYPNAGSPDRGRPRVEWNRREVEGDGLNGSKDHPPAIPPPEPEKKRPPMGPPNRDPKPEPIKDPLVPPPPGKDPLEEPKPIGDPPDKTDPPMRMGVMTRVCSNQEAADFSPYRDRVSFSAYRHRRISNNHDSLGRSLL